MTSDGTVVLAQSSVSYTGRGGAAAGMVKHHAFVSDDGHAWRNVVVDSVHLGVPCVAAGCYPDYYSGHSSVTADDAGGVYFVYDGATRDGGRQRIFFTASFDGGDTWSPPRSISTRTSRPASR